MLKLFSYILLTLLLSSYSWGQISYHSDFEEAAFSSNDPLQIILSSQPDVDKAKFNEIKSDLDELVDKLKSKRESYRNDNDAFLEWAFYYVHRKKLGWYENYVSFGDIFLGKKYDCLTGTILYSYLLDQLNYKFSIYELDYHIFMVVHLPGKNVLLEATDPLGGYINEATKIQERIDQFMADGNSIIDVREVGELQKGLQGSEAVRETVDLHRLAGLQYFNLAVKAFTNNQYDEAHSYIRKAEKLYPSDRILGVKQFMISAL
ncbi:MAG: hypothetical protein RLQ12_12695 [Cyclobacteriaceae bacterium]